MLATIPVGGSDFFFVPRSRHVEYSIFSCYHGMMKFSLIKNDIPGVICFYQDTLHRPHRYTSFDIYTCLTILALI